MRILVVDDELVSRKKMQKIMEQAGECESYENGTDALEAFTNALESGTPFNLISLDIAMPGMSGIEVLTKIRALEYAKKIDRQDSVRIMMVTSHSDQENVVASLKAGCNNYIVKPFDKERVFSKLESLGFSVG
ncbi:MAG: response regulator [Proteobacteria bacterium]|nr:response regulator [Pseudomonadota bacterium]